MVDRTGDVTGLASKRVSLTPANVVAVAAAVATAVVESAEGGGHDAPFIGVCALDTAAGQLLVGAWRDDEVSTAATTTCCRCCCFQSVISLLRSHPYVLCSSHATCVFIPLYAVG